MQYIKKPIVVDAVKYNGHNREEICSFVGSNLMTELESDSAYAAGQGPPIYSLAIPTKEGIMKAFPGDYVIKEPFPTGDRDFYPCKPSIFESTYNPAGTFKQRLLTEKAELNEKRSKLDAFIGSEKFRTIEPVQKSLLQIQFQAMATYAECLIQRIAWLEESELGKSETENIIGGDGLTNPPHEPK